MENATENKRKVYPCDKVLRERLSVLRELPGWSNNVIAKRMGVNPAVISQYLNDEGCIYPGDIKSLETKITDLLDNEARRQASGVETVKCDETQQVRTALEYIRKTSDIGLIIDSSGGGKTRGCEFYVKENPTAIFFRAYAWCVAKKDAERFMFDKAGQSGYDNRTPRTVHAVNKLRGSERLIVVDDAHFLHHTALLWWVHFHEATQMPLALGGTFELLKKIEADPQIFSRVGLRFEIKKLDDKGGIVIDRELIKHLIHQLLPNCNGELADLTDLCEQVAREHGQYRSVHKQLKVTAELKAGNKKLDYCAAFRAAHTMLVRNYPLS
jgi:DNA transposition AAA+ family ATPase